MSHYLAYGQTDLRNFVFPMPISTLLDLVKFPFDTLIQEAIKLSMSTFCRPFLDGTQLFKSFEFGNGRIMSDENLVILESKYLQSNN